MGYTIDCKNVTLPKILERIHSTDLVPSLTCLKTQAEDVLERFRNAGVHNLEEVREVFNQLGTPALRKAASKEWNIEQDIMDDLFALSSFLRIRWLSPSFTRIFHDLQHTVATLQHAQADRLTKQIDECNKTKKYYKGKVVERDINRIIHESRYVED